MEKGGQVKQQAVEHTMPSARGARFDPLPVRAPMVMPNLAGVTLEHLTSIPMESGDPSGPVQRPFLED